MSRIKYKDLCEEDRNTVDQFKRFLKDKAENPLSVYLNPEWQKFCNLTKEEAWAFAKYEAKKSKETK